MSRRLRLLLAAVSLALGLVLGELGLHWLYPAGFFPLTPPDPEEIRYTLHDAHLGWRLRPGAEVRERTPEWDVAVRINVEGLRADREHGPAPSPGKLRVLAVGDSFTFGVGVQGHQSWPSLMEGLLPHTEWINLGVPGWGTDQQYLDLSRRMAQLAPQLVVLGLFTGDVPRNVAEHLNGIPKPWLEPGESAQLVLRGVPVAQRSDAESRAVARGGLLQRLRLGELALRAVPELVEQSGHGEAWPRTEAILRAMEELCRQHGAGLQVLLLPRAEAVEGRGLRRVVHRRAYQRLREIVARAGIASIDPLDALEAWGPAHPDRPAYFPLDHHLTGDGQRLVAEAVAKALGPDLEARGRSGQTRK